MARVFTTVVVLLICLAQVYPFGRTNHVLSKVTVESVERSKEPDSSSLMPLTRPTRWPPTRANTSRPRSALLLSLILLLCGDVHCNPGPINWKNPCASCNKPVRANQEGLFCEVCLYWNHRKCVGISAEDYYLLGLY